MVHASQGETWINYNKSNDQHQYLAASHFSTSQSNFICNNLFMSITILYSTVASHPNYFACCGCVAKIVLTLCSNSGCIGSLQP